MQTAEWKKYLPVGHMDVQDSERQHSTFRHSHISETCGHANTATNKPPAPKGPSVLQFPTSPDMMEMSELCALGCTVGLLGQSWVRATDLTGQPLCCYFLCSLKGPPLSFCTVVSVWMMWPWDSLLGLPSPILVFLCLPLLLAPPHPSPSCESRAERDSPTRHHLKSTLQPHPAPLQQLGW